MLISVDLLIEIINLVASIIGIVGIPYAVIELYTQHLRNTFSTVCRLPAPEVASYDDVYKTIFNYYDLDKNNTNDDLAVINKKYLSGCVREHYKAYEFKYFEDEKDEKQFPLICKSNWLMSNSENLEIINDGLKIENGKLCETSFTDEKLKKSTEDFLRLFQIESYPDFLASIGKEIWNDRTFDLCFKIEENNKLKLQFVLGRYYNYVKYYDIIAKELYFHLYYKKRFPSFKKLKLLPMYLLECFIGQRSKKNIIRGSVEYENIFDFQKRPVKLGINVFVLMKNDKGSYSTFIQKRGEKQVEYPGFYHVAPAGTFQPLSDFDENIIKQQCHFEYTILRELLEEVYNLEEADKKNKSADPFNIFRLEKRKGFIPGKRLLSDLFDLSDDEIKIPDKKDKYLFSWDEIPGNDNRRLKELLIQDFGLDCKIAKIRKIDSKTLKVSTVKNRLSLKLNYEQNEAILTIDDGRTKKFIMKMEKNKLKIYDPKYEIIKTGFLIDLVTLKPELTVLLHIKDIEVYKESKKNIEGNWEGRVKEYDINTEDFRGFLDKNLNINNFLPAGAVAMAEGLNYYFKNKQNF